MKGAITGEKALPSRASWGTNGREKLQGTQRGGCRMPGFRRKHPGVKGVVYASMDPGMRSQPPLLRRN